MIKTSPRRVFVNLVEATTLLVLILLAAYVSIGRLVISQVDMFREAIETRLSSALQVPVHISSLQGEWSYLDPRIIINGFSIGTSTERGITFDRMSVGINSVLSLVEADLVVSDLAVDRLSFRLKQSPNGVWAIDGLPARDTRLNLEPLLASMPHVKSVELTQVDIDVVGLQAHYQIHNQTDQGFDLVADGEGRSMSLPLVVERLGDMPYTDTIALLGKYAGDPRDQETFSASLYLQVPNLEMMDLLPAMSLADTQITKLGLSGEFWLEFHHGAFELVGSTVSHALQGQRQGRSVELLSDLRAEFAIVGLGDSEIQWYFDTLSMTVGNVPWVLDQSTVILKRRQDDMDLVVYSPALSITDIASGLTSLSQQAGLLPDAAQGMLTGVHPRGQLEDVYLSVENLATSPTPHLVTQIDDLQLSAYEALPGISRLDGLASLGRDGGYLDLHNTQPFTLNFKSMFSAPWPFDVAQGQLRYRVTPDALLVESGLLSVAQAGLVAGGRVQLRLPASKDEHTWGLEVGVRDADLLDAHRFLPSILSPTLLEWLGRAVNKGTARQAGMVFHGSLFRDAPKIRKVHELYFDVDSADLTYDPVWPVLENVDALVYINNIGITAADAKGQLLGNQLQQVTLNVPITLQGADSIFIGAAIEGELDQGLRLLNETPISDLTRQMAQSWRANGSMSGKLHLDVPIGARTGEPIGVDASIDLDGGDLLMQNVNLSIEKIEGQIRYETREGVSAEPFTALIFGESVISTISSMKNKEGHVDEIRIVTRGSVATDDLYQWSGQPLLSRIEGKLDYESVVHVPAGDSQSSLTVEAHSDLQGVVVHLPPPMEKLKHEAVTFDYEQTFYDDGYEVGLQLDDVKGRIRIRENQLVGGRLHFGPMPLGAVTFDALRVSGQLQEVDYARWLQLSSDMESATQDSLSSELIARLDFMAIHAKHLQVEGMGLDDVDMHISRADDAWHVELNNKLLGGLLTIPDQDDQLLIARLDYMVLESDSTDVDPMAGIDPRELPGVDFSVKNLRLGTEDYGRWAFKYRPTTTGGSVSDLSALVKNIEIDAGSTIDWSVVQGLNRSRFSGVVNVPELGRALTSWGYAASIEGKDFVFNGDLQWPGSPVMIALNTVSGDMRLDAKEGRFVQAESAAGALKLLGIFDFASLANRFRFDFSDIVEEGFSFKTIQGSSRFNQGVVDVIEPIVITGSGGTFRLGGRIDLANNTLDNDLIVTLPVSRNLPWYAAYSALTNPLLGAGVLLARKVFESQINQLASAKYKVSGTMDDPIIEFVSIFNDSVRDPEKAGAADSPIVAPTPGKPLMPAGVESVGIEPSSVAPAVAEPQ
ncbi:MAG: hypothetical protein ACI9SB_000063 [Candidatus Azotimanducaceae bacterium]|jgi:uncharacterized protein (TIGR02099 family)